MPPRLRSSATLREPAYRPLGPLEPLPFPEAPSTKVKDVDDDWEYFPYSESMFDREQIRARIRQTLETLSFKEQRDFVKEIAAELGLLGDSPGASFEVRLREYVPPANGIETVEQAREAKNLASSFRAFASYQESVGLPAPSRPDIVKQAETQAAKFYRDQGRLRHPPRPRGRPKAAGAVPRA